MKKIIAMLLALCLTAMLIPAMAESSSLEALLGTLGDSDKADQLSDLAGMLGALGGNEGASDAPAFTAVPADSLEQFYGTWALSRIAIGSMEIPMEMLRMLGVEASGEITFSENTVKGSATFSSGSSEEPTSKEAEIAVEMALVDGALNVVYEGETLVFQLTDAGELASTVPDVATVFFTPVA